jgi:nicotinamide mononucleotide transporter
MNWLEWLAAALGVITVLLVVRRSVWNYPFALAMVSLYFFVFLEAKFYSDMLLQVFFFVVNLYGWWNWTVAKRAAGTVPVGLLSAGERFSWLASTAVLSMLWGFGMARYTDAVAPLWDAGIAGFSIAAQILQARRRIESWLLWILVDIVAIWLFWSRGLFYTSGLFVVLLLLSVAGLRAWLLAYRSTPQ